MTTGGPFGERSVTAPQLLDLCDRALGEVSRRHHLFGWLRAPGTDEWLPLDAYYPGNRLVVLCRDGPSAGDELIDQRVPEHGLRLLRLAPGELAGDPAGVQTALSRQLDALGPPPPRPRAVPIDPGPGAVARTVAALAQREPAPLPRRPLPRPVTPPREAVTRGAEFVAARRVEIDELAHAAALSRHGQPLRRPRREPIRPRTSGAAASRGGAPTRAMRRHPATAALLIAVLVVVVVVVVAIVSAAHG